MNDIQVYVEKELEQPHPALELIVEEVRRQVQRYHSHVAKITEPNMREVRPALNCSVGHSQDDNIEVQFEFRCVEIIGGQDDGQRLTVKDIREGGFNPLMVPSLNPLPFFRLFETLDEGEVGFDTLSNCTFCFSLSGTAKGEPLTLTFGWEE